MFANNNYTTQAQIYSISAVYRLAEMLDLSLALQQIRSFSDFATESGNTANNIVQLTQLTRTRTVESSLSARAEYRLTKNFSCVLDYSYRDYDEKLQSLANGTVQTVSAYLRAKW
jgi:predicted porin